MRKRINSFRYAFNGIRYLVSSQPNAQIHLIASILVVSGGIYFDVSREDWIVLSIAMALVWITEALNTAIEVIIDLISPDFHELAGKAKDVSAGAVLFAAIFALIAGYYVFFQPISNLF